MFSWSICPLFLLILVAGQTEVAASAVAPVIVPIEEARAQMIAGACTEVFGENEADKIAPCIQQWMQFIDQHLPPTNFCVRNGALADRTSVCQTAIARGLRRVRHFGSVALPFGLFEANIHCNEIILCGAPFPPQR